MLVLHRALRAGVRFLDRTLSEEPALLASAEVAELLARLDERGVRGAAELLTRCTIRAPGEPAPIRASATVADAAAAMRVLAHQRADGSFTGAESPAHATVAALRVLVSACPSDFPDAAFERGFFRDGYVVRDLLDQDAIAHLLASHRAIEGTGRAGFYSSWFRPTDVRLRTDAEIRAIVEPALRRLLPGYRMVFATFMTKGCEGDTSFPIHQDPTLVDERRVTPVTYWIPLVDVDLRNGCMHAVIGSHLLSETPRPSFDQFAYPQQQNEIRARYLTPIPMRAGQLLAFHSAIVHASPSNATDTLRVAVAGVLVPDHAPLRYYRRDAEKGVVAAYAVEDGHYLRMHADDPLDGLTKLDEEPFAPPPLDLADLPRAATDGTHG